MHTLGLQKKEHQHLLSVNGILELVSHNNVNISIRKERDGVERVKLCSLQGNNKRIHFEYPSLPSAF